MLSTYRLLLVTLSLKLIYVEEVSQLINFGKFGYKGLQSKTAICCLFSNRTYESNMNYHVVKKARNLKYGDATDYLLKLVELLGNYHNPKGSVFEMASDKGGRLETLYWSGSFSSLFIKKYSDFILIDGTRKTNIYDLSLVVTTIIDSSEVSIPTIFLVSPSENSLSIESHLRLLRIVSNSSPGLFWKRNIIGDDDFLCTMKMVIHYYL